MESFQKESYNSESLKTGKFWKKLKVCALIISGKKRNCKVCSALENSFPELSSFYFFQQVFFPTEN
jgi:hypothetical protein